MNGATLIDDELRDIQGFQSIMLSDSVYWILIGLVVIIVVYCLYKFVFAKKAIEELTQYQIVMQELDNLDMNLDSKNFYLTYSDIVRNYFLCRLELNLFDKTLNELRFMLEKEDAFDLQSKNELVNIFAVADMAKFARKMISKELREEHLFKTKNILDKIESFLEEKNNNKEELLEVVEV